MVEGQLHDKGDRFTFEDELVDRHAQGCKDDQVEQDQPPRDERGALAEKDGRQEGDHHQAGSARDERRQHDGQQARPARVDDPGADDGRHVAAKAQKEGQEGAAVEPHCMHKAIHHIGRPGHIAEILQQPHAGEKDDQDREKGEHGPGAGQDPIDDQSAQPWRLPSQELRQPIAEGGDQMLLDRVLQGGADGIGEPKDEEEGQRQHTEAPKGVGRDAVEPLGQRDRPGVRPDERGPCHPADPLVAAAGDVNDRILVRFEELVDLFPGVVRQASAHQGGHLAVAFK